LVQINKTNKGDIMATGNHPTDEHPVSQKLPWRPSKRLLLAVLATTICVLLVLAGGYFFNWTWTGFGSYTLPKTETGEFHREKTLWDWMQLLIIPAVLAVGAFLLNRVNAQTQNKIAEDNQKAQNKIAEDNQREVALQTYIDKMSELLLDKGLHTSQEGDEIRNVARTRTLAVLRRLNAERKGILLEFLYDSKLISSTPQL
jgi:hypothetical protein